MEASEKNTTFVPQNKHCLQCSAQLPHQTPCHAKQKFCNRNCYRQYRLAHPPCLEEVFWNRVEKKDCWLYTGPTRGQRQYGALGKEYAHRFVWRLTHGDIPDGLFVLHRCDVPNCVNPSHLFLGTHLDNMRDMREKGRSPVGDKNPSRRTPSHLQRGEKRWNAKLNEEKVREIRALFSAGIRIVKISKMFSIHHVTVISVVRRKTWKHVI